MNALQALTGSGGWPMSMFLTPDMKPFFGATYLPPESRNGKPSFPSILERINDLWKTEPEKIIEAGNRLTEHLKQTSSFTTTSGSVGEETLKKGYDYFTSVFDPDFGGFGRRQKFPIPLNLNFLLRYSLKTGETNALNMTLTTLKKMAEGGIYDHIGGGFHRYAVDRQWRVPHFEKMLYDQALLSMSYLEAYQFTHKESYRETAREILDYVLRELSHQEGGFYSAVDAESGLEPDTPEKKEEGAFYLWTKKEIIHLLGSEKARIFNYYYGVEEKGNAIVDPQNVFIGKNILYLAHSLKDTASYFKTTIHDVKTLINKGKQKLFTDREKRIKPFIDDKILVSWNGLMISAMARAYQVLGEKKYLAAAEKTARFIFDKLYNTASKTLLRRYREGESRHKALLQDYAFLTQGLIDLYESSLNIRWLEWALELTESQNQIFYDKTNNGFFDTSVEDNTLIIKTKDLYDGVKPSGNAVTLLNLMRLSQMTDNKKWKEMAEKSFAAFSDYLNTFPQNTPQLLTALDFSLIKPKQVIIAGGMDDRDTMEMLRIIHSYFIPNKIILLADGGKGQKVLSSYLPFLKSLTKIQGKATAYICENYTCKLPTTDKKVVARLLGANQK